MPKRNEITIATQGIWGVIYGLSGPDNQIQYVGQSVNLRNRFAMHLWTAHSDSPDYPVHRWIKKINYDVQWKILDTAENHEDLNKLEIKWIADLRAQGLAKYNLAPGGAVASGYRGESTGMAKLTQDQAMEILDLAYTTDIPFPEIGGMFGVSGGAAYAIYAKLSWKHLEHPEAADGRRRLEHLGDDAVKEIIARIAAGETPSAVSRDVGCTTTTTAEIAQNLTYKHIPRPPGFYDGYHRGKVMTEDKVREIRKLSAEGVGTKELAERFGTSLTTIKHIKARRTWSHVA